MKDRRIVKYNVDFVFKGFKFTQGAVEINLSVLKNMKGEVIADWSVEYAEHHLKKLLAQATGIKAGWSVTNTESIQNPFNSRATIYKFDIESRLYTNLRRIYERPK